MTWNEASDCLDDILPRLRDPEQRDEALIGLEKLARAMMG
jgi:hypothetical protein